MYLLLLVCLLLPVQALAVPLSYNFSGTLGDGGSISGFMSYESSAAPIATDVRGLLGNAVYAPTAWNFTIHSPYLGSTFAGNTIEFCTGKCIFGTLEATTIRVGTSGGVYQMGFNDLAMTSLRLNSSHFKFTNQFGEPGLIMLASGQATGGSVPLPSTFFLFAGGLGLVLLFRQWCSNSMRRLSNQDT
jgi:hypothetical protein